MKKVLQIEDQWQNRLLIERILASKFAVFHAESGEEGIQKAIELKPDLILIDIGLPDFDGHTVLTMLRQIPDLQDTQMVALTAWPPDLARDMCERYGYDGCITKPIDVKGFPDLIATYLDVT